jgi:predicted Zn-dependent protease
MMGIQMHEIGHNLGLLHSGDNVNSTYSGKVAPGRIASFVLCIKQLTKTNMFSRSFFSPKP